MGSVDINPQIPQLDPRAPEMPELEEDVATSPEEASDVALRTQRGEAEAPRNPFENNVDTETLAALDQVTRGRQRARVLEIKPEPFPAHEETPKVLVAEAEPVKSTVAEMTDAPAEDKPEQGHHFDTAELDTLKQGDAIIGVTGGRAFIVDRRENEGDVLFDISFFGNPEKKTFTLNQLKNSGAGIQSIERGPEKTASGAGTAGAPEEQIQLSKTFDRVFLEELKQTPADKFKNKNEVQLSGSVQPAQDAMEQVQSSKRYDREFLEILKATPAERFIKQKTPDAPKEKKETPEPSDKKSNNDQHDAFADLLTTEKMPQVKRKERSKQRRRDEANKWESGDSGGKPLKGVKNTTAKAPEGGGVNSKSPERSPGPDLGELLRVRKEESVEKPSDGSPENSVPTQPAEKDTAGARERTTKPVTSPIAEAEPAGVEAKLAESIEKDPRYIALEAQLVKEWEKKHGAGWVGGHMTPQFQEFMYGDSLGRIEGKEPVTLHDRVLKLFAEQYPDDFKRYQGKQTPKTGDAGNYIGENVFTPEVLTNSNLDTPTPVADFTEPVAPTEATAHEETPVEQPVPDESPSGFDVEKEVEELLPPDKPSEAPVGDKKEPETKTGKAEKYSEEWLAQEFGRFNISQEDLEQISEYAELSHGQRLMLLENFKQSLVGRINVEAEEQYQSKRPTAGFLAKIWHAMAEHGKIAREKRASYQELTKGGINTHRQVFEALTRGLAAEGPEIEVVNGKLEIQYVREEDCSRELSDEEKESLKRFNAIATEYARIPYEWSLETASSSQQKKFRKAQETYEVYKKELFGIEGKETDPVEAMQFMNKIDEHVELQQFLNTHPEVEKQLQKIESPKLWREALKNVMTERGLYMVGGGIARVAAVGAIGFFGAPLAAGGIGLFVARRRTNERLRRQDVAARAGGVDTTGVGKNVVSVEKFVEVKKTTDAGIESHVERRGLIEKIETAVRRLATEQDLAKRSDLMASLQARLNYTQDKIDDGLVDFGGQQHDRIYNYYGLQKALADGWVALAEEGSIGTDSEKSQLEQRLDSFLNTRGQRISKERKAYLRKQMLVGAGISAGAAVLGYGITSSIGKAAHWLMDSSEVGHEAATGAVQETAQHASVPGPEHAEMPVVPDDTKQMAADILPESAVPHPPVDTATVHEPVYVDQLMPETPGPLPHAPIGTAASGTAEMPIVATHAAEHAVSEPAVDSAAAHAAEQAAPSAPAAEHAGILGVEIHKGEGMIEAVGRTFETQYGLPHERAMALANRVWAEHDPQKWYDLVHSGDKFSVDIHGVTPDALKTGDVGELAKQIEYDPSHFDAASHIAPAHELPHNVEALSHAPTAEAAGEITSLGKGFTADQAYSYYSGLTDHHVTVYPTSAKFLADNQIQYDPASHQLWRDINADGIHDMSDKTITLQLQNAEQIDSVRLVKNTIGDQLLIEAWDKGGKALGTFAVTPDLEPVAQNLPEAVAEAAESAAVEHSFHLPLRFIDKLTEFKQHAGSADWLHKTAPSISQEEFAKIPVQIASGSKRGLMKYLETQCEAPKGEAKAMTKTLHYIFEGLRKGLKRAGEKGFAQNETVGSILKTLDLSKPPTP